MVCIIVIIVTLILQRYLDDHLRRNCIVIKSKINIKLKPYENEVIELKNELNRERILRKKIKK